MNTARITATLFCMLALAACGEGEKKSPARKPQLVAAMRPVEQTLIDHIEAVGTARGNEQVVLSSAVNERIEQIYFEDGDHVREGQIILRLAQGEERAALSSAVAAEQQASSQLKRIEALSAQGYASNATLDQQVAASRHARSEMDKARAQIADRIIRAPFAGYISLRTISRGAIVNVGSPIATISDISRIKLDFTIPETSLAAVHIGQNIVATAAAYPDKPFRGTISMIDPAIDPATRAVTVRALLPNGDRLLKPGMLLAVSIEAASHRALMVPEVAVLSEGSDRYVFAIDSENKAVRTKVETGLRNQGMIEVKGVPANARIISEGVVKVADGVLVTTDSATKDSAAKGNGS